MGRARKIAIRASFSLLVVRSTELMILLDPQLGHVSSPLSILAISLARSSWSVGTMTRTPLPSMLKYSGIMFVKFSLLRKQGIPSLSSFVLSMLAVKLLSNVASSDKLMSRGSDA